MKLAFLGTSTFAVPALQALVDAGHTVAAVYTRTPKPAGRGQPGPGTHRGERGRDFAGRLSKLAPEQVGMETDQSLRIAGDGLDQIDRAGLLVVWQRFALIGTCDLI